MKYTIISFLFLLVFISSNSKAQLPMGKYSVGFKYFFENDYTRSFGKSVNGEFHPRPMQINVWYPSSAISTKTMTLSDYSNLYPYQLNFSKKSKQEMDTNTSLWKDMFSGKGIKSTDSLLKSKTNALLNAIPAKSKHPVVIYIPGAGGEGFENFVLCEYLASNGFVVISFPSFGAFDSKISIYPIGIESQVADINFLYGYISKLNFADKTNVSLMGFSMGGLTTLIFSMRKLETFKSVICMDGSIRSWYNTAIHIPGFNSNKFKTPFLLFSSGGEDWTDTSFINSIRFADRYLVKIDSFNHLDFTSYNYFGNNPLKRKIYENSCLLIKDFLEQTTKNTVPVLGEFSENQMKLTSQYSEKIKPVSEIEFKEMIGTKGIEEAKKFYYTIKVIDSSVKLFDENEFIVLAFDYFNNKQKPVEAIEIMKLVVDAYPLSYVAVARLARIYEKNKDSKNAALFFNKALQMAEKIDNKTPDIIDDIEYYKERVKANGE